MKGKNYIEMTNHVIGGYVSSTGGEGEMVDFLENEENELKVLIDRAKREAEDRKKTPHELEIERRRRIAINRIAIAGAETIDSDILYNRLVEANMARISECEAMANIAEKIGDFLSHLVWLDVRDSRLSYSFWKGYVFGDVDGEGGKSKHIFYRSELECLEDTVVPVVVYRIAIDECGYIAILHSNERDSIYDGISLYTGNLEEDIKEAIGALLMSYGTDNEKIEKILEGIEI